MRYLASKKMTVALSLVLFVLVFSTIGLWIYRQKYQFHAAETSTFITNTANVQYELNGTQYNVTSNPAVVEVKAGLIPPTVALAHPNTYKAIYTLKGTKSTNIAKVFVNNSTTGVTLGASTWTKALALPLRTTQRITVFGQDASGNGSASVSVYLTRFKAGDTNNDNYVNLRDASYLMANWAKVPTTTNYLADLNEDRAINSADFSVMLAHWNK